MRRRFAINDAGELVDRGGYVLGRVTSLTLEMRADVELPDSTGGYRGVKAFEEKQKVESTNASGGGVGEESNASAEPDPVDQVWATYVEVMEPRRKTLDPEGRRVIRDALKVATADECQRAIHGCKASAFHMGQNERRKKYNKLSHILKGKQGRRTTREQIDLFIDIAEKGGIQAQGTSADPARISHAKRAVLAAAEFPGDSLVAERGREAERFLMDNGWVIERDGAGWPSFRSGL